MKHFRLLRVFCPDHLIEEIEGDLLQRFERDAKKFGVRSAKRRMLRNTLRFFRPGILKRRKFARRINSFNMIGNYLTMALRVFSRQWTYSLINIAGLSIGLASSVLISLYVLDEWSYDKWIPDADNIYRVGVMEKFNGEEIWYTSNSSPLAEAMQQEIPEVMETVRFRDRSNVLIRMGDQAYVEPGLYLADSNFFSFFKYPLIDGDPATCLKGPNKLVLSVSAAEKYFNYEKGGPSPVGKQLLLGDRQIANEVTGIYEDLPRNTHFKPLMIQSFQTSAASRSDCWACYGARTYVKTVPGASMAAVQAKLDNFAEKRIIPRIETDLKISHDQFVKSGDKVMYFIQPVTSIHLRSHHDGEFEANGDFRYVILFSVISGFLVVIACINFINLATAGAMIRAKEVGIRKSMGALRNWLVQQFMLESFVYVTASAVLAFVLVALSLSYFNDLSGKYFTLSTFIDFKMILGGLAFVVGVGILAGAYPSFYLSSLNPSGMFKSASSGTTRSYFRNALVVFQFATSMALIICTLMIYNQLGLIQQQNLGFDKENVLIISQTGALGKSSEAFRNELLHHQEFVSASFAQSLPPNTPGTFFVKAEGKETLVASYNSTSDEDLQKTLGLEMKAGRYFSREFASDSSAVVINETCARLLDYDSPVGKSITFDSETKWTIVGVVKDFNFMSLHSSIGALVIFREPGREMAVRVSTGNLQDRVRLLESLWKQYAGNAPFQFSFLDENIESQYRSEEQMGKVFWVFTTMAILIACLGLFGLITFAAGQRTKEIGIRKVLGASVAQISLLLSRDLIKLVAVSFLIAVPVTWYGMNLWLQGFVYRVSFDFASVVIAGLAGICIAVLTISYKSFQAASRNPVESLKNE